ncbi:MAG TPA: hypothetical protein VJC10_02715 [Patescibacteria group bacterium]|nr:hypothetical protein [Patescibacteria group bacterium]
MKIPAFIPRSSSETRSVVGRSFFRTKILFIFFLLILGTLFVIAKQSAAAQEYVSPQTSSYSSSRVDDNVPRNQHTHTQIVLIELLSAINCQITGIDPVDPSQACLDINPVTKKIGYAEIGSSTQVGGLVGVTSSMISALYVPPASSVAYVHYVAQNFGVTKQAIAQEELNNQGTGFVRLQSLLNLWTKFRNVSYLALVFVFLIIGIAIMLRVHIDPRTVMTIQNQIPKIIVGIILITFSYAIAGLLVDLTWTTTYLGVNLITDKELCDSPNKPFTKAVTDDLGNNPIAFVTDILGDDTGCFGALDGISGISITIGKSIGDALSRTLGAVLGFNEKLFECDTGLSKLGGILDLKDCARTAFFGPIKYLLGFIGSIIVGIAIIIALIRTWFMLLKSYIRILFYVIFAPFWIILGLIPGNSLGFNRWLRTLVANLVVFPAAALMFVLAAIFASDKTMNNPDNSFLPPLIGHPNIADNLGLLIAFGLFMLAPELINMIRDGLKSPPSKYGAAIGTGFGKASPMAALSRGGQLGYNLTYARSGLKAVGALFKRG